MHVACQSSACPLLLTLRRRCFRGLRESEKKELLPAGCFFPLCFLRFRINVPRDPAIGSEHAGKYRPRSRPGRTRQDIGFQRAVCSLHSISSMFYVQYQYPSWDTQDGVLINGSSTEALTKNICDLHNWLKRSFFLSMNREAPFRGAFERSLRSSQSDDPRWSVLGRIHECTTTTQWIVLQIDEIQ